LTAFAGELEFSLPVVFLFPKQIGHASKIKRIGIEKDTIPCLKFGQEVLDKHGCR